jgi:hypothetical protein
MTFSHFSDEILEGLSPVIYEQQAVCVHQKPLGLWLSVDGEYDWPWWCENESFRIGGFRHSVMLQPDANILRIASLQEFDEFQRRYLVPMASWATSKGIDWEEVAHEYGGIVIAPYQWERRLSSPWYYTWDCASACIWDLSTIQEIVYKEKTAA